MKRWIIAIPAILLMTGCTRINADLNAQLSSNVEDVLQQGIMNANYGSVYYSYYTEPDVGRLYANGTGNIFTYKDTSFVMNLNIPAIINDAYYTDQTTTADLSEGLTSIAAYHGTYTGHDEIEHPFQINIFQEANDKYLCTLVSDQLEFYTICSKNVCGSLAAEMLRIARSVIINKNEVLDAFSNRQTISYTRKKIEMFQNYAPINGVVDELIETDNSVPGSGEGSSSSGNYATDNYPDTGNNVQNSNDGSANTTPDSSTNDN